VELAPYGLGFQMEQMHTGNDSNQDFQSAQLSVVVIVYERITNPDTQTIG
jgi:hypothetical protein